MLYQDGRSAALFQKVTTDLPDVILSVPWATSSLPTAVGFRTDLGAVSMPGSILALLTTANLTTVVDVTGSGYLDFLLVTSSNVTASTVQLRITLDGTVAFDVTTPSSATANRGLLAVGELLGSGYYCEGDPLPFKASLKIEAQASYAYHWGVYYRYRLATPYST